jgi:hypothetical protein
MFLLDSLLIGGIQYVLDKVATVAEQELNDPEHQRERLLEAQMQLESGEITDEQFAVIETDVFDKIREIKARTQNTTVVVDENHRVAGVEITVDDESS